MKGRRPPAHDTHPLVVAQARLVKRWVFGNGMKVLGGVPNLFGAHEVSLAEALLCQVWSCFQSQMQCGAHGRPCIINACVIRHRWHRFFRQVNIRVQWNVVAVFACSFETTIGTCQTACPMKLLAPVQWFVFACLWSPTFRDRNQGGLR